LAAVVQLLLLLMMMMMMMVLMVLSWHVSVTSAIACQAANYNTLPTILVLRFCITDNRMVAVGAHRKFSRRQSRSRLNETSEASSEIGNEDGASSGPQQAR